MKLPAGAPVWWIETTYEKNRGEDHDSLHARLQKFSGLCSLILDQTSTARRIATADRFMVMDVDMNNDLHLRPKPAKQGLHL